MTRRRHTGGSPARRSAELERFFFLDDADRALVGKRRGDHNRLGFSLQLGTARFIGLFLPDPLDVPPEVVDYLARQLGIADAFLGEAVRRAAVDAVGARGRDPPGVRLPGLHRRRPAAGDPGVHRRPGLDPD